MATIDNYVVNIQVKGDADLKNVTTSADGLGKKLEGMGSSSGSVNQFNNRLKEGSESMSNATERMNLLKDSSEKLLTTFVGLGAIDFVHNLLETADATDKTANAFGMTIERTLELQASFQKAGIDGQGFARTMTTVADAMVKLQHGDLDIIASFKQLGLTYDDLKGKSPDQQLVMITKAAADSKKTVEDLTAAHTLLGKKMSSKDLKEFNDTLQAVTGTMGGAAESTKHLKEVQDNLEMSAIKIKTAFLELITPVAEFFAEFTKEGDHSKLIAEAMAAAMVAIGGTIVIGGINAVIGAVTTLTGWMIGLFAVETTGIGVTGALTAAELNLLRVQAASAVARAESLAATVAETTAKIRDITATEADVVATAELVGAKRALMLASGQLALAQGSAAGATAGLAAAEAASVGPAVAAAEATTVLTGAVGRLSLALVAVAPYAIAAGAALALLWPSTTNKGEDEALKQIHKFEDALASLPKAQLETYFKMSDAEQKRVADAVKNGKAITDAMSDVSAGKTGDSSTGKGQFDQLAKVRVEQQNQLSVLKQQQEVDAKRYELALQMIGVSQVQKVTDEARFASIQKSDQEIFNLENQMRLKRTEIANTPAGAAQATAQAELDGMIKKLGYLKDNKTLQAEVAAQQAKTLELAKQENEVTLFGVQLKEKALMNVASIQDEINALTMTGDQQKMASIQRVIEAEARAEIKRRESLLSTGQELGLVEKIDILHQVAAAYDPVIAKQKELTDTSRDFQTGWNKAFNSYMDDATNAAKRGETMFTNMTNTMNSAIDNFVTTGKFSFTDLATSMIQDMLKIELKAEATQLMGALKGGAGGLFSSIGSIFGFAGGGDPPVGQPSIVGENGPEVFIPKTAGTIVPNGGSMSVTNQGMAPTNNVTNNYNISAIDSKSVAQFFAENRKTMLGTMQMAQKELPYGNR